MLNPLAHPQESARLTPVDSRVYQEFTLVRDHVKPSPLGPTVKHLRTVVSK
jgi:hypothetical protein